MMWWWFWPTKWHDMTVMMALTETEEATWISSWALAIADQDSAASHGDMEPASAVMAEEARVQIGPARWGGERTHAKNSLSSAQRREGRAKRRTQQSATPQRDPQTVVIAVGRESKPWHFGCVSDKSAAHASKWGSRYIYISVSRWSVGLMYLPFFTRSPIEIDPQDARSFVGLAAD